MVIPSKKNLVFHKLGYFYDFKLLLRCLSITPWFSWHLKYSTIIPEELYFWLHFMLECKKSFLTFCLKGVKRGK